MVWALWNHAWQLTGGVLLSMCYGKWASNQTYLTTSGAFAGWSVLLATYFSGVHFFFVFLSFILCSFGLSKALHRARRGEEETKVEGLNWAQVLAPNIVGVVIALTFAFTVARSQVTFRITYYRWACELFTAFIGHYASCSGITWGARVSTLTPGTPRLITSLRRVPRGTKGAISILGSVAAIFGGFVVGVAFYTAELVERHVLGVQYAARASLFSVLGVAIVCGLAGYLIDSLIGATLQYSGWSDSKRKVVNSPKESSYVKHISGFNVLNNHGVIILSTLATSVLAAVLSRFILFLELSNR